MRIFLIGFMGSGKSFLGKIWAEENNLLFYDLDKLIEEAEQDTIANIFSIKGESYFREKEAMILKKTISLENSIIACGGGTACFYDNMQWMNKNGTTVFLNQTIDYLVQHLMKDKNHRPLIASLNENDLRKYIHTKLEERLPFYNQSEIILHTDKLNAFGFGYIKNQLENGSKIG